MDGSFLSPKEQQCYSSLFSTLDSETESTGRVKTVEALQFFLKSGLKPDVLQQITEICGANRLGHFGRSQFYIALKLIAMAQNAIPLPASKEMIAQGTEIPLPTFVAHPSGVPAQADPDDPGQMEFINPAFIDLVPDCSAVLSGKLPPAEWHVGQVAGVTGPQPSPRAHAVYPHVDPAMSPTRTSHVPPLNLAGSPPPSPPGDSSPFNDNPPLSPPHTMEQPQSLSSPISAREQQPLDKQGNAPVFLPKSDEGWASFDKRDGQGDSQTTNSASNASSDSSWAKFPDNRVRSGSHDNSSGHDGNEDVWLITPEQREYYTNQFKTLLPDTKGLLSGADSKDFFEKSKLPTAELSKIWQLSDVNKDGTLSLAEFCTAMHLVVARRHKVDLPDQLPASLIPVISPGQEEVGLPKQVTPARSVTPPTPSTKKDENWATFADSPFPAAPSPSSQSPANFDFASISPDPDANIFQPVALHVAPDGKTVKVASDPGGRQRTHSDPLRIEALSDEDKVEEEDSAFTMKKRAATVGEKDILAKLAPPPPVERTRRGDSLERQVLPTRPTIPPRPITQLSSHSSEQTHSSSASSNRSSYSSSLDGHEAEDQPDFADFSHFQAVKDDNKVELSATGHGDYLPMDEASPGTSPPPPPPPRHSQSDDHMTVKSTKGHLTSPMLSSKDRHMSSDMLQADEKRSQFANDRTRHTSAPEPAGVSSDLMLCDRKSIQAAIRRAKEENTKLSRLNSELQQELKQITEERLSLEIDLKKLRPFAVNT